MTNAILRGKPDAGNPHVRFDEGEVASAKPRRGSLLYKRLIPMMTILAIQPVYAGSEYPTVNYGDTVTISTDQSGDSSVKVAGKLLVTGGKAAQTTGTRITLGSPVDEAGDVKTPAAIVVTGGTFGIGHGNNDIQLNLGEAGGRGGVQVSGGTFAVAKYNISANAQTNDSGYVDYLLLSDASATVRELYNNSAYTARVAVAGASKYATAHGYYGTLFQKGPTLIDCSEGAKLTFDVGATYKTFNASGIGVRVIGAADVVFSLSGGKYDGWVQLVLNSGASFENAGSVSLSGDSVVRISGSNMFSSDVTKLYLNNVKLDVSANTENEIRAVEGAGSSIFVGSGTLALRPSSEDDKSSVFIGKIDSASTLTLAKRGVGTSTATVSSGVIPRLKLEEGTIVLNATCSISDLAAERGTTLVADGCEVSVVGLIPAGVSCEERNGGRIVSVLNASEGELGEIRKSVFPATVNLTKTGTGELRLYDPDLAGSVHVAEGTLSFSHLGLRDRYLKFTLKEILPFHYDGKDNPLRGWRGRIYFYNTNDVLCTDAKSYNTKFALGTHPSALTKGEVTASADTVWTMPADYTNPFFMFRTSGGNPCLWLTGVLTNAEDNVHFQEICYRLPDPIEAALDGINVYTSWDYGSPKKWTVESSATGEDGTWQTILDKNERCAGMHNSNSYALNNDKAKPAYHFSYVQQGVQGLADTLQIQVDEDATLDFTTKDEGQAVDAIVIDLEKGGGTVKGAKLAATGTMSLVHATKNLLKEPLPLVFENLGEGANLANWTLMVNGEQLARPLKYDAKSGKVSVVPSGLLLLVR